MRTLGQWGITGKIEPTRNTFANPAIGTDGVVAIARPDVSPDFAHDGARNGTGGQPLGLAHVQQSGMFGKFTVEHEFAGQGGVTAYDATHLPSPHTLFRTSGYDAAFAAGIATYTPSPMGTDVSGSYEAYYRGLKAQVAGCIGQLKIAGDAGAIPKASFDFMGTMAADPAQAAVAAITYANAQITSPAKLEAANFTAGGYAFGKIKSFSFADNRNVNPRALDNATGNHGGFAEGSERVITLDVVVEGEDLANYNAYQIRRLATAGALAMNVGAAVGLRWQLTAPKAQLLTLPEQDDNNVAMWTLSYRLFPSALGLWDAVSFIFPNS